MTNIGKLACVWPKAQLKAIIACNKFSHKECMTIDNDIHTFLIGTGLYHEEFLPTSLNDLTKNSEHGTPCFNSLHIL